MEVGEKFQYQVHLFICTHCSIVDENGSPLDGAALQFRKNLKELCSQKFAKADVRINVSGCLSLCQSGINAVIYPQNIWLTGLRPGEEYKVVEIIDSFL